MYTALLVERKEGLTPLCAVCLQVELHCHLELSTLGKRVPENITKNAVPGAIFSNSKNGYG